MSTNRMFHRPLFSAIVEVFAQLTPASAGAKGNVVAARAPVLRRLVAITHTSMLLCTAFFIASFSTATHAADPPSGSYRHTCAVSSFRDSVLAAYCSPENGGYQGSSQIDVRACGAEVFNRDGGLQCYTRQGWGSGRAIPRGSYIDSCKNVFVAGDQRSISAQCKDNNGNYRSTKVSTNSCPRGAGGGLDNNNGNLVCPR